MLIRFRSVVVQILLIHRPTTAAEMIRDGMRTFVNVKLKLKKNRKTFSVHLKARLQLDIPFFVYQSLSFTQCSISSSY